MQQSPLHTSVENRLSVEVGGHSIAGRKPVNQDAFAAQIPTNSDLLYKGVVAAIADGVSSCEQSHIASQTSVTSFIEDYYSTSPSWSVKNSASRVLTGLNAWIAQQNKTRQSTDFLCTFSAVILKSQTLSWFHVGDSRIYHHSQGSLHCLTQDHVYKEGRKAYLARALGGAINIDVDYSEQLMAIGDLVLLTTDGVHEVLSHSEITGLLELYTGEPEATAKALVDAAYAKGSADNLTALLIEIVSLAEPTLEESHESLTHLPIPPALKVGNKIDGYTVTEIIFSGTRSHMYQVVQQDTGKTYVLKAPSDNFADDLVYLDGFVREEWVGQHLKHQNVMKTYPSPNKKWLYYLAEHIDGISLRQWMHDHPDPDLTEVRALVAQIIAGLRHFQRADMLHQDIKPENIMIEKGGRVVVIDFGTTRISGIDELASPLDKSLPQGSVGYVAPEYLMGEAGSSRSDLFSLAVVIYEMLVGKLPYEAPKQPVIKSYSDMLYRSVASHKKRLPVWLEASLIKALKANPIERYSSFSEFAQDLNSPNKTLVIAHQKKPLVERHPLRFWQGMAFLLMLLVAFQQYWIHSH